MKETRKQKKEPPPLRCAHCDRIFSFEQIYSITSKTLVCRKCWQEWQHEREQDRR